MAGSSRKLDAKQLGWSPSLLTSPSHQSSHHSLSPCVAFAIVGFVRGERDFFLKKKERDFYMFLGFALDLFSSVPELAWSKAGRAQVVVASCSHRFSSVFIIFLGLLSSSPPHVETHSRMISVSIRRRKKKFVFLRWSWSCGYHGC